MSTKELRLRLEQLLMQIEAAVYTVEDLEDQENYSPMIGEALDRLFQATRNAQHIIDFELGDAG
jgi:uncharacterized protein with HEPN domain